MDSGDLEQFVFESELQNLRKFCYMETKPTSESIDTGCDDDDDVGR